MGTGCLSVLVASVAGCLAFLVPVGGFFVAVLAGCLGVLASATGLGWLVYSNETKGGKDKVVVLS